MCSTRDGPNSLGQRGICAWERKGVTNPGLALRRIHTFLAFSWSWIRVNPLLVIPSFRMEPRLNYQGKGNPSLLRMESKDLCVKPCYNCSRNNRPKECLRENGSGFYTRAQPLRVLSPRPRSLKTPPKSPPETWEPLGLPSAQRG